MEMQWGCSADAVQRGGYDREMVDREMMMGRCWMDAVENKGGLEFDLWQVVKIGKMG